MAAIFYDDEEDNIMEDDEGNQWNSRRTAEVALPPTNSNHLSPLVSPSTFF